MDSKEIAEAVKEALEAEHASAKHHCWRKRLVYVSAFTLVAFYVGEVTHVEFLCRGFEFICAGVFDKLIFGIAE